MGDPTTAPGFWGRWKVGDLTEADGTQIGSFLGANGYVAEQATASKRPVIYTDANGKRYLKFDHVDDELIVSTTNYLMAKPAVTVYLVFRQRDSSSSCYWYTAVSPGNVNRHWVQITGTEEWRNYGRRLDADASSIAKTSSGYTVIGEQSVATMRADFEQTYASLYENGTLLAENTTAFTAGLTPDTSEKQFVMGGGGAANSARFAPLDLYEILVYEADHGTTDRSNVHSYVQDEYPEITVSDYVASTATVSAAATLAAPAGLTAGAARATTGAAALGAPAGLTAAASVTAGGVAKAETLTDDFTTQDTAKWTGWTAGSRYVEADDLVIVPDGSYPSLRSAVKYDALGSHFGGRIAQVATTTGGTQNSAGTLVKVEVDGNNFVEMSWLESGSVACVIRSAGVNDATYPGAPAGTTHVRIAIATDRTITWEAFDGTAWSSLRTGVLAPAGWDLTQTTLVPGAGFWEGTPAVAANSARFASVGLYGAPAPALDWGSNLDISFGAGTPNSPGSADLAELQTAAGEAPSVELWYRSWVETLTVADLDLVRLRGATSELTWEAFDPALSTADNVAYSYANIIAGNHDAYITATATTLRDWGHPIYLRVFHEMNGTWYPWCVGVNGNTAQGHKDAWAHVRTIFANVGATNVRWSWSPNVSFTGSAPYSGIYPGDAAVDVIAFDGYNWGDGTGLAINPGTVWESPQQVFKASFDEMRALATTRPFWIGETGSAEAGGSKAEWIDTLGKWLSNQPEVECLVWFHHNKERDWRISSSITASDAFKVVLANYIGFGFGVLDITDNFDRPDDTTGLGPDWDTFASGVRMVITGNQAAPVDIYVSAGFHKAETTTDDQWAEVTIAAGGGNSMGIALSAPPTIGTSEDSTDQHYLLRYNGTSWAILRKTAFTLSYTSLATIDRAETYPVRFRAEREDVNGVAHLRILRDGVEILAAQDTAPITGFRRVGIRTNNSAAVRFDDFAFGDPAAATIGAAASLTAPAALGAAAARATGGAATLAAPAGLSAAATTVAVPVVRDAWSYPGMQTSLEASPAPTDHTGAWSHISGPTLTLASATSPTTRATAPAGATGTSVYRWTVTRTADGATASADSTIAYRAITGAHVALVYAIASDEDDYYPGSQYAGDWEPRIQVGMDLVQEAMARMTAYQGIGRQSFTLDRDADGRPVVHFVRLTQTGAFLRGTDDPTIANDDTAIFDEIKLATDARIPADAIPLAIWGGVRHNAAGTTNDEATVGALARARIDGSLSAYDAVGLAAVPDTPTATALDAALNDTTAINNADPAQWWDITDAVTLGGGLNTRWSNAGHLLGGWLHEVSHGAGVRHPDDSPAPTWSIMLFDVLDHFGRWFVHPEPGDALDANPEKFTATSRPRYTGSYLGTGTTATPILDTLNADAGVTGTFNAAAWIPAEPATSDPIYSMTPNGSFESGLTGWSLYAGSATLSQSAEVAADDGSSVLRVEVTATGTVEVISDPVPVAALGTFSRLYSRRSATVERGTSIATRWLNSAGTAVSTTNVTATTNAPIGSWAREHSTTSPTDTTITHVQLRLRVVTPAAGEVFYFDRVELHEGSSADFFGDPPAGNVALSAPASLSTSGTRATAGAAALAAPAGLLAAGARSTTGAATLGAAASLAAGAVRATTATAALRAPAGLSAAPTRIAVAAASLAAAGRLSAAAVRATGAAASLGAPARLATAVTRVAVVAANLQAAGHLSATAARTTAAAANLRAAGRLSAAGARATTAAVALQAPAYLSASLVPTVAAEALLRAPGHLAAAGARTAVVSAALRAAGHLQVGATATVYADASLAAPARLVAAPTRIAVVAATLAAAGRLATEPVRATTAAAALTAAGHVRITGAVVTRYAAAHLRAAGHLAASTVRATHGAAALGAPAALGAVVARATTAAAPLRAAGSLFVGAAGETTGGATLAAPALLAASAARRTAAAVVLRAAGRLSAAGSRATQVGAALVAPARLTVVMEGVVMAAAALRAPAALAATGARTAVVGAALRAPGRLAGAATRVAAAAAGLRAAGHLATSPARTTFAGAALRAAARLTATPLSTVTADGALEAAAGLAVTAGRTTAGAVDLTAPAGLAIAAEAVAVTRADLTAAAALSAGTARETYGAAALSSPAALIAALTIERFAHADLGAPASLATTAERMVEAVVVLAAAANLVASATSFVGEPPEVVDLRALFDPTIDLEAVYAVAIELRATYDPVIDLEAERVGAARP